MSDSDFPDPDFPDPDYPFYTPALHRHCVDTNGRDDFDCDADWKASYFERNQQYFHTTKRDAVSIFSERTMKSVALKSSLKLGRTVTESQWKDHVRSMQLDQFRVKLEFTVRLLLQ